jgi:hypothetical protein
MVILATMSIARGLTDSNKGRLRCVVECVELGPCTSGRPCDLPTVGVGVTTQTIRTLLMSPVDDRATFACCCDLSGMWLR